MLGWLTVQPGTVLRVKPTAGHDDCGTTGLTGTARADGGGGTSLLVTIHALSVPKVP